MSLSSFPHQLPITVQWGEMDVFAHVNNAAYVRWGESARISYFEAINFSDSGKYLPILGFQSLKYISPVAYPDRVSIGTRVDDIQSDRFVLLSHFFSEAQDRLVAIQYHEIVVLSSADGKRVEVPGTMIASIKAYESQ